MSLTHPFAWQQNAVVWETKLALIIVSIAARLTVPDWKLIVMNFEVRCSHLVFTWASMRVMKAHLYDLVLVNKLKSSRITQHFIRSTATLLSVSLCMSLFAFIVSNVNVTEGSAFSICRKKPCKCHIEAYRMWWPFGNYVNDALFNYPISLTVTHTLCVTGI